MSFAVWSTLSLRSEIESSEDTLPQYRVFSAHFPETYLAKIFGLFLLCFQNPRNQKSLLDIPALLSLVIKLSRAVISVVRIEVLSPSPSCSSLFDLLLLSCPS